MKKNCEKIPGVGGSEIDGQLIGGCDETRTDRLEPLLESVPFHERRIDHRPKVHQRETFCPGAFCDPDRILRVEVRPLGARFSRPEAAFSDEEVCIPPEPVGVVAETGIGAVRDRRPVNFEPVPEAGGRVDERQAFESKRQGVSSRFEFPDGCRVREPGEGYGERLADKSLKVSKSPGLGEDRQPSLQPELDQRMQPGDMIDVEMADEDEDRFLLRDVPVCFCNPVPRIEDNIVLARPDKDRGRISRRGVVPSVGAKECHLHASVLEPEGQKEIIRLFR